MDAMPVTNRPFRKRINTTHINTTDIKTAPYVACAAIKPRTAARRVEPVDTSASRIGLRCIRQASPAP
jgi:hypothetical protein